MKCFGLRAYGTNPQVWGGDPEHDPHEWRSFTAAAKTGGTAHALAYVAQAQIQPAQTQGSCPCGAWRGELGSEPTPEKFIANLVEVFREVRRVLRPDGTCWINLGDSYAGSGKGPTGHNGIQNAEERQGFSGVSDRSTLNGGRGVGAHEKAKQPVLGGGMSVPGLPAKNLLLMPFRVALALQADGWWLRACLPWVKRNSMPESVTDRPSSAVEYVFLLAKAPRYFWDAEAVRRSPSQTTLERWNGDLSRRHAKRTENWEPQSGEHSLGVPEGGRSFRNSDIFYDSLGLILSDDGEPLALDVNPAGYPGAHFATYPTKLIEPLIRASTSERGCCPTCLAPWTRVVERGASRGDWNPARKNGEDTLVVGVSRSRSQPDDWTPPKSLGWTPSCRCVPADPIPCVVLDPFSGSGTSGLVASRLGRDYIGVELNPEYAAMSEARINSDEMLFSERVQVEAPADFVPLGLFSEASA